VSRVSRLTASATQKNGVGHTTRELLRERGARSDTPLVAALTVGVISGRSPECKRGLAVNLAASLARDPERGLAVCVVDADPLNLDVTTRLQVRGPVLEEFGERDAPASSALGSIHEPPLWVLPSVGAGVGLTRRATERALRRLRLDFDVVVCDLLGGPDGPARVVGGRLDPFDWLLVAVTPQLGPVAYAARCIVELRKSSDNGEIAATVGIGVVITGDEGSGDLAPAVVAARVAAPVLGSVRQLWGRAAPNLGFGAALGIEDLDDAVSALFEQLHRHPDGRRSRDSADRGALGAEFSRAS